MNVFPSSHDDVSSRVNRRFIRHSNQESVEKALEISLNNKEMIAGLTK